MSDLLKAIKDEFKSAGDLPPIFELVVARRLINVLEIPIQLVYRKLILKPFLE